MSFVKIGRRYFFGWQDEKRRYSRGYIEAFQRSQAEKEPVSIHKSCVVRLYSADLPAWLGPARALPEE